MRRYFRLFFSPEGGGGDGGVETELGTNTESLEDDLHEDDITNECDNDTPQLERPKYFAQVAQSKANSEDYKRLYKYQKIDELADAYLAQENENNELKERYKNSIVVPKADDLEGVKKFKEALGIPDTAEGYTLSTLKNVTLDDKSRNLIKEVAHEAMLSDKQADAVGVLLLKTAKMAGENFKQQRMQTIKTFDTSLIASYKDIINESDRKNSAERDKASFEHFATESGLKDFLDDRGLSYDTDFVKKIASYARKHAGNAPQSNLPASDTGKKSAIEGVPKNFYGKDFVNTYKK